MWTFIKEWIKCIINTVQPGHTVTSIKQSPVLGDHLFLTCTVIENFIWIEPLLRGHLSNKATFSLTQQWPLNTGFTVHTYTGDKHNL